ncbi:hypothetical protein IAT40_002050 [Kwoniella sp. CBS 6097]
MARHPTETSWQASPGEIFRPPPSYAPTNAQSRSQHPIPHSRSAGDLLFDSDLIPSLQGPDGIVGHAELMGRGLGGGIPQLRQQAQQQNQHLSLTNGGAAGVSGHVRSSSFEDRMTMSRPFAGAAVASSRDGGTHARNWSTQSTETIRELHSHHMHEGMGMEHPESLRPGNVRRTSSYGHPPVVRAHVESSGSGRPLGHARTASESTADISYDRRGYANSLYPHSNPNTQHQLISTRSSPTPRSSTTTTTSHDPYRTPNRSTSLPHPTSSVTGGVTLGSIADTPSLTRTLGALCTLTPFDRIHDPPPPAASSRILHPFSLLTPMAIILEALVVERSILKGELLGSTLPVLRDGRSLQLFYENQSSEQDNESQSQSQLQSQSQSQSHKNGIAVANNSKAGSELSSGGELDWTTVKWYILSLGRIIDDLLPYLREQPSSTEEEEVIEELVKSVRAYVGKMKKVFGEVASMYGDQYSFMRGLWDDGEMKGAAGEVGRWGDLFDA